MRMDLQQLNSKLIQNNKNLSLISVINKVWDQHCLMMTDTTMREFLLIVINVAKDFLIIQIMFQLATIVCRIQQLKDKDQEIRHRLHFYLIYKLEQMKGIEPSTARWQRAVIPFNHICL